MYLYWYFLSTVVFDFTLIIFINTKSNQFSSPKSSNIDEFFKTNITQLFIQFEKQCKCGEEIVNDYCTEEQILSRCIDISLNSQNTKKNFKIYGGGN